MDMLQKIEKIMLEKGYSKADLARGSDLPYTTIAGLWTKGTENAKRSTIIKLARFLGVSLDYLADDDFSEEESSYYLDPEVAAMAEELKNNPQYRVLFDASRKVSKKDMEMIIDLVKRMAKEDDTHHSE